MKFVRVDKLTVQNVNEVRIVQMPNAIWVYYKVKIGKSVEEQSWNVRNPQLFQHWLSDENSSGIYDVMTGLIE